MHVRDLPRPLPRPRPLLRPLRNESERGVRERARDVVGGDEEVRGARAREEVRDGGGAVARGDEERGVARAEDAEERRDERDRVWAGVSSMCPGGTRSRKKRKEGGREGGGGKGTRRGGDERGGRGNKGERKRETRRDTPDVARTATVCGGLASGPTRAFTKRAAARTARIAVPHVICSTLPAAGSKKRKSG